MSIAKWACTTCSTNGRHGYCAPLRCYCAHPTCHAYASWEPLPEPFDPTPAAGKKKRNAWADRQESTWIDQM